MLICFRTMTSIDPWNNYWISQCAITNQRGGNLLLCWYLNPKLKIVKPAFFFSWYYHIILNHYLCQANGRQNTKQNCSQDADGALIFNMQVADDKDMPVILLHSAASKDTCAHASIAQHWSGPHHCILSQDWSNSFTWLTLPSPFLFMSEPSLQSSLWPCAGPSLQLSSLAINIFMVSDLWIWHVWHPYHSARLSFRHVAAIWPAKLRGLAAWQLRYSCNHSQWAYFNCQFFTLEAVEQPIPQQDKNRLEV